MGSFDGVNFAGNFVIVMQRWLEHVTRVRLQLYKMRRLPSRARYIALGHRIRSALQVLVP